jgi:hypothetical protein
VSWSGVKQPKFDDWIAVYVPADADPSQTAPAKYQLCALDADHIYHGRGRTRYGALKSGTGAPLSRRPLQAAASTPARRPPHHTPPAAAARPTPSPAGSG